MFVRYGGLPTASPTIRCAVVLIRVHKFNSAPYFAFRSIHSLDSISVCLLHVNLCSFFVCVLCIGYITYLYLNKVNNGSDTNWIIMLCIYVNKVYETKRRER